MKRKAIIALMLVVCLVGAYNANQELKIACVENKRLTKTILMLLLLRRL
ncbi:MAG: hypothetical protein HY231_21405 [Acidobacteria bacterium]|nr:hypothetical protein [Acidobacteriota bacterium]